MQGEEGAAVSRPVIVQGPGHNLFSRSRFPQDQHGKVDIPQAIQEIEKSYHGR